MNAQDAITHRRAVKQLDPAHEEDPAHEPILRIVLGHHLPAALAMVLVGGVVHGARQGFPPAFEQARRVSFLPLHRDRLPGSSRA